ncbi:MAG TPA: hypothetical protein VMU14_24895, partial [Acidimicrobiales bacterium]|nr:hypothetical protein [Acidimicrobiales bacterium]
MIAGLAGGCTGVVVAARGTVDLEQFGTGAVFSSSDVEGAAQALRQQRPRAVKVGRRLEARVEAERSAVEQADAARRRAVGERELAVDRLERFERALRSVADATAAVADATDGEARAEQELAVAEERGALLARHREDLESLVRETEERRRCAEETERAAAGRQPPEISALRRGAASAGAFVDAAAGAHARWLALEDELHARAARAIAERAQLRTTIEGLRSQLEHDGGTREAAVRAALSAYEAGTSAPTDAVAVAMADRWR